MARSWRWRTGEGPPISAADPTEAATLRRDLDADQARRRRIELPTLTGIVVLGFVTAFRGTTVPWLYALGGWFVALSAVLLFARRQRTALERGTNARGRAPMLVRDSGESATVIRAPLARIGPELARWSLIASPLVAGGAWAVLTGHGAPGLLLCALGAWSSTPIVLVVTGQVSPGGVWLTPTAVVVRDRGLESRIPWRCLVVVSASGDGSVVLRADASAGMIHRKRSRAWSSGVRTASPSVATVDTRWLALDATALTGLLEHYRRDGCVGELGTHASLVTVAAFSR